MTDLIAWTTTTLNSSGISDINDVICFINRSTLLSLPVYNTQHTGWVMLPNTAAYQTMTCICRKVQTMFHTAEDCWQTELSSQIVVNFLNMIHIWLTMTINCLLLYMIIVKKLNSLKHLVRTTVQLNHTTKTANIKKALLLSSTSPCSQCADK